MWLDLFFPRTCVICGEISVTADFCSICWNKINFLQKPACERCYKQFQYDFGMTVCQKCDSKKYYVDKIRSPIAYDDASKQMIIRFKNFNNLHAGKLLAKLMASVITDLDFQYVIPVPLHVFRFIQRGYNQSMILAEYLSKYRSIAILKEALIRKHFTKSQGKLTAKKRIENVRAAFKFNTTYTIKNANILLVDDVYTTGSTVEECAKLLKQNGAKKVYVVTGAMRC